LNVLIRDGRCSITQICIGVEDGHNDQRKFLLFPFSV
jgi:hypothetical protein